MAAGIGLNTLLSLTAIGLWLWAPRGAPSRQPPAAEAPTVAAPLPPVAGPRFAAATRQLPVPPAVRPPLPDEPAAPAAPAAVNPTVQGGRSFSSGSATANALGAKLHLNPRVLTDQLGDASGEIPKPVADRLERAFKAGEAAAKRLGLDEARATSFVSMITFHAFSLLREEKVSGSVPASRRDEIAEGTVADVRAACGDPAAAEAKRLVADL
jgi:hypothetical protein